MSEPERQIMSILGEAVEHSSPAERAAFVAQACCGDTALRARLEALVQAYEAAGNFLQGNLASSERIATVDEPTTAEHPGTTIGPYKLLEQIGEGGFGIVFMAEQQQPVRRKVALKILKPGMDTRQIVARFEAERQALAIMDHANIARVFDGGASASGRPFFVMELVRGVPITDFCDQHHLALRQRLELFLAVCQAVQHAHQKGIIHRDLKPSNVLVTVQDTTPVVKVIDFGVAKALGQELTDKTLFTGFAQMIGTPLYMSPEQAGESSLDIDTRTDIYTLGVLLYELLTGTTPFDKDRLKEANYEEIRRIIREEEPPKPSTRVSTLGQAATTISTERQSDPKRLSQLIRGELDWIVMKCLEKDRNRRYETASALAADVQHYLKDEPVVACPPSAVYRLRKLARRHKRPLLAAALVLLALIGGIIGTTAGMVRAQRAQGAETEQRRIAQDNEKAAKEREAETRAVLSFVETKILAAARPKDQGGGQGYDVKLADAVKSALPFVDKSFTSEPLIEGRLRRTMGISFFYLGDAKTAIEQFQAAREIYTVHLGPDHPETLHSMNGLASAYYAAGRIQEALKLLEETHQLKSAQLGPDHVDTLKGMNNLALAYLAAGRIQEALKLRRETLELQKAKLGPNHPDTLRSMMGLAFCYLYAGHTQEAIKLHEETIQLKKVKLGPDHPDTLLSMMGLARSLNNASRTEEALKLSEETFQLQKAQVGPDHPDTLSTMMCLGIAYRASGRTEEAIKLHEKTLQLQTARLGTDHPDTVGSMQNLASSYADAGRIQEALELREKALRLRQAKFGPGHPDTLMTMSDLADSYADAGRTQEALKLREATLQAQITTLGRDHPDTLASMNNLADSYIAVGEAAKALSLLHDTLALRERHMAAELGNILEQSSLAWTHGQIGAAEQARLDYAAAVPAYARSVEMFDKLDQAGALMDPLLRGRWNVNRQRLALCRKAGQAVQDLDFALQQPAAEVPGLLDLRVRFLLKEQKLAAAVESAAKMTGLAGDKADQLYQAACAYALCAGAARQAKSPVAGAPSREKLAERALALLKQAVAKGYKDAAHIKQDRDLDALGDRADFKKLLTELEAGKKG
jgi:serine/threonine protein kinase/tetratricopeptide (TPR) repeat protein